MEAYPDKTSYKLRYNRDYSNYLYDKKELDEYNLISNIEGD